MYQCFSWGCSSKRGPENGPLLALALLVIPTVASPTADVDSFQWTLGILSFKDSVEVEAVFLFEEG